MKLGDEHQAHDFVVYEIQEISKGKGVQTYETKGIPGATSYILFGATRQGNNSVFCQGVWFAVADYAAETHDCAGAPRAPDVVTAKAREQYQLLARKVGLPPPSP